MIHVLDVMKKMNMLTQTQTEQLLKENMAIQENSKRAEVVEWNNSAEVAQKSQASLFFGGMVTQSCHSDCEMVWLFMLFVLVNVSSCLDLDSSNFILFSI